MCIWMQLYLHRKNKNCKLLIMLSNKCCEISQSVINCKQSMWSWYHINKEDTTSCSCLLQLSWQMFLFPCTDSRGCHRLLILILKTGQHFVQFWLWLTRYIAAGQHRSKKMRTLFYFLATSNKTTWWVDTLQCVSMENVHVQTAYLKCQSTQVKPGLWFQINSYYNCKHILRTVLI